MSLGRFENKRLGITLLILSLVFGFFLLTFNNSLQTRGGELGCMPTEECVKVDKNLTITHVGFGFFGFMLGLGFYLLFFGSAEQHLIKRIEQDHKSKLGEEKFSIILKALDPYEVKVMRIVREQEGITQNTLRLRCDMSKAKLSYVLVELEKRNLIKRVKKGKTLQIFTKI